MDCPSYTPVVNKTNKLAFLFIDKCFVYIGDDKYVDGVILWGRKKKSSDKFEDNFCSVVISKTDFDNNYTIDPREFSSKFEDSIEPASLKFLHNAWLKRKCEDAEQHCLY